MNRAQTESTPVYPLLLNSGYFTAGVAEIATAIDEELARQQEVVELIAS